MIDTELAPPRPVTVPPRSQRIWFALGRRLDPEHRPWVAQQILSPRYAPRRSLFVGAIQTFLVVLPNELVAWADKDGFRASLYGFLELVVLIVVAFPRSASPAARQRQLAYHGVRADGTLREPWKPSAMTGGFTWLTASLMVAQVLLVSVGGAVVFDRLQARSRCHPVSQATLHALDAVLGKPSIIQGYGPEPLVPVGTRLVRAKQVDEGLTGITYLAGYAHVAGQPDVGPAVWRVIVPGGVFQQATTTISAANDLAEKLTPSLGYSESSPADPAVDRAADCVDG